MRKYIILITLSVIASIIVSVPSNVVDAFTPNMGYENYQHIPPTSLEISTPPWLPIMTVYNLNVTDAECYAVDPQIIGTHKDLFRKEVSEYPCKVASASIDGECVYVADKCPGFLIYREYPDEISLEDKNGNNIYDLCETQLITKTSYGFNKFEMAHTASVDGSGKCVAVSFFNQPKSIKDKYDLRNPQVYVVNRLTKKTELVSANTYGYPSNGFSSYPLFSANGRYVLFRSYASDLVVNDSNNKIDLFVRDLLTKKTTRISPDPEMELYGNCESISANGRYITFCTTYPLSEDDQNSINDVYLFDQATKEVSRASIPPPYWNEFTDKETYSATITGDGTAVYFSRYDYKGKKNIFRYDIKSKETKKLTMNFSQPIEESQHAPSKITRFLLKSHSASYDGRILTYVVDDGVPIYGTKWRHVMAYESISKSAIIVDRNFERTDIADKNSTLPSVSSSGRYIAFFSAALDLVKEEHKMANPTPHIYVYDLLTDKTIPVSITYDGEPFTASNYPQISADGRFIVFRAFVKDGGPEDGLKEENIFITVNPLWSVGTLP